MGKELNVHVTYGTDTFIIISKQADFLSKTAQRLSIKEDEMEIYEINKKTKRKIGIESLKDFIKVEIKKISSGFASKVNGKRHCNSEMNKASSSNEPTEAEIVQKITENRALTGSERTYLIRLLQNGSSNSSKRKADDGDHQPVRPEMRHKKIQVNPVNQIDLKSSYTQTDKLINFNPKRSLNTSTKDVEMRSRQMASAEKIDVRQAADLMTRCFDQRRNFILIERPVVSFVKEKYPLLFSLSEVRNELDRIFYDGKCEEFMSNIEKYAEPVLSLAKLEDPLLITTRDKAKAYSTPLQKKYALEVGSLLMLSSIMGEERNFLKLQDTSIETTYFPYIQADAKLHGIFFDQYLYKVYVEGLLLCEASNLKEAIMCLIASYFIFNIRYPEATFNTLVVIEKVYLQASDTEESEIDEFVQQIIKTLHLKAQARAN